MSLRGIPKGFWFIVVVGVLWHILGVLNFLVQTNPESLQNYPAAERAIIEGRPFWATLGFAASVFGGFIASVLLFLKKKASYFGFVVSLVGTLINTAYTASIALSQFEISGAAILIIVLMPNSVSAFYVWYSRYVRNKFWV